MKFLITGITGFVGPNLAKLLLTEGHEVHGAMRTPNGRETDLLDVFQEAELDAIKFHYLDLKHYYSVEKLLSTEMFDGVFHLAAQSHPPTSFSDPILTFEENVMATVNIITALKYSDTKLMFCSTSEVYGNSGYNITENEIRVLTTDEPLAPINPYGVSKAAMDLYMQERMANGFIKGYITRAFAHTGIRRGYRFSISSDAYQIAKMKLGLQEPVLRIGNLTTMRAVIDVRDCVHAYYMLMINDGSNGRVFNVSGTEVREMQFFTDKLIELAELPFTVEQRIDDKLYRPIDILVQIGDTQPLKDLTGWKPQIPIEMTLKSLLDYWVKKLQVK